MLYYPYNHIYKNQEVEMAVLKADYYILSQTKTLGRQYPRLKNEVLNLTQNSARRTVVDIFLPEDCRPSEARLAHMKHRLEMFRADKFETIYIYGDMYFIMVQAILMIISAKKSISVCNRAVPSSMLFQALEKKGFKHKRLSYPTDTYPHEALK